MADTPHAAANLLKAWGHGPRGPMTPGPAQLMALQCYQPPAAHCRWPPATFPDRTKEILPTAPWVSMSGSSGPLHRRDPWVTNRTRSAGCDITQEGTQKAEQALEAKEVESELQGASGGRAAGARDRPPAAQGRHPATEAAVQASSGTWACGLGRGLPERGPGSSSQLRPLCRKGGGRGSPCSSTS